MTLADKTERSQTERLSFELDLKHSPAKVWRALTDPVLLAEWLLPVIDLKLEPGAKFAFKGPEFPDWDGTVNCQVVEIEEHRKLRYTWSVPFLDTVVTFTLAPTASGTRLTVEQSGFKSGQKQEFGGSRYAWKMMGQKLIDLLARMP